MFAFLILRWEIIHVYNFIILRECGPKGLSSDTCLLRCFLNNTSSYISIHMRAFWCGETRNFCCSLKQLWLIFVILFAVTLQGKNTFVYPLLKPLCEKNRSLKWMKSCGYGPGLQNSWFCHWSGIDMYKESPSGWSRTGSLSVCVGVGGVEEGLGPYSRCTDWMKQNSLYGFQSSPGQVGPSQLLYRRQWMWWIQLLYLSYLLAPAKVPHSVPVSEEVRSVQTVELSCISRLMISTWGEGTRGKVSGMISSRMLEWSLFSRSVWTLAHLRLFHRVSQRSGVVQATRPFILLSYANTWTLVFPVN